MEVKDIMKKERTVSFIDAMGADPDDAYERVKINRTTIKQYKADINSTNTNNMPEALKEIYADIYLLMLTASEMEMEIARKG